MPGTTATAGVVNPTLETQEFQGKGVYLPRLGTSQRVAIGTQLGLSNKGLMVYDVDLVTPYQWNGAAWVAFSGGGTGGAFLVGVGAPAAGTGSDGDTYDDTDSGDIYSKSGGAWSFLGNVSLTMRNINILAI